MVTTFVRLTDSYTKGLWRFLEEASRADMRLSELDHPSLQKLISFCSGRDVHPSFYRALKLKYSLDVGGISKNS